MLNKQEIAYYFLENQSNLEKRHPNIRLFSILYETEPSQTKHQKEQQKSAKGAYCLSRLFRILLKN